MNRLSRYLFILLSFMAVSAPAQVLTWSPAFPTRQDTITLTYDAKLGNAVLMGESAVYIHTGVITNLSEHANDWRYHTVWPVNTTETRMQALGNDRWQIRYPIDSFYAGYGLPATETIQKIACVFRNASGGKTGKAADGSDLFIPLYGEGLNVSILSPDTQPYFMRVGDSVEVVAVASRAVSLCLFVNDEEAASTTADTLRHTFYAQTEGLTRFRVVAQDASGAEKEDCFRVIVPGAVQIASPPGGALDGITRVDDHSVILSLYAPGKTFVYVIGDFSNWEADPAYALTQTPDRTRWWIRLEGLEPGQGYGFQYLVDGTLRVADPYAGLVLDPWNDSSIPESTYPNLKPYPAGQTTEFVSVFRTDPEPFAWTDEGFQRPAPQDLVIYELLIRDFLEDHTFATLIDTLDYLERLGVNAIELMPVNEFEGNDSWGYNPAFYFAVDKAYGPAEDFRRLVDEAHHRGMAVIMDMVLNHAYGQCPLVRLYWDSTKNRPAADNPWFNVTSPNTAFSWGFDFNHQSAATQAFVDRVLAYWVESFHVDGFRLDFTKGFTNTPGDGGGYDGQRIGILNRIGQRLWSRDPNSILILEHFAANTEETELARNGFLLWGNMNTAYSQAAMGYLSDSKRSSDFSWGYFANRGWSRPGLVSYMESHDEPWMMYKVRNYGNQSGDYHVQDLATGLQRVRLAAAFFLTIPGPKMLWQFGELGYDENLPESGYERTARKPLHWDYRDNSDRFRLYQTVAALNHLRRTHAVFSHPATQVTLRVGQGQADRRILLSNDTLKVAIIGNFGLTARGVSPQFQATGWWHDYFSGDSVWVTDPMADIPLEPGEFKIYTDRALETPELTTAVAETPNRPNELILSPNYPNPFNPETAIAYQLDAASHVRLDVVNLRGQVVKTLVDAVQTPGSHQVSWRGDTDSGQPAASGVYWARLRAGGQIKTQKMVYLK